MRSLKCSRTEEATQHGIRCLHRIRPGGHVCGLFMPAHPLHGRNFGVVGTVTSLVDLWATTGRDRCGVRRPLPRLADTP
jgi:hypothetical protein